MLKALNKWTFINKLKFTQFFLGTKVNRKEKQYNSGYIYFFLHYYNKQMFIVPSHC